MAGRGPSTVLILLVAALVSLAAGQPAGRSAVAERVMTLTRDSPWQLVTTIPVTFMTQHPQGMVTIADTFVVSSVDKIRGVGHLFKIDLHGSRLADSA